MICVRGRLSVSGTTWRRIRENTGEDCERVRASYILVRLFVCVLASVCSFFFIFFYFSAHAAPSHPPASVSKRNLRMGPGPHGSCLDWISNQCYTSCVLATAIFNTLGEALPGGKGKLSSCVGSSMGDIIIRMQWKRLDSRKMDDGLSQCFNFIVIRYSWGGRESGINVKSVQLSAAWSVQYVQEWRCRYLLIDQNRDLH